MDADWFTDSNCGQAPNAHRIGQCAELFHRADKNGDAVLTHAELVNALVPALTPRDARFAADVAVSRVALVSGGYMDLHTLCSFTDSTLLAIEGQTVKKTGAETGTATGDVGSGPEENSATVEETGATGVETGPAKTATSAAKTGTEPDVKRQALNPVEHVVEHHLLAQVEHINQHLLSVIPPCERGKGAKGGLGGVQGVAGHG